MEYILEKNPIIKLKKSKKTKIIATVGPKTYSYEAIFDLISNGANGLRLNFSHGTYEEKSNQIKWIRKASKELSKPVSIIMDLQGPKIRLGDFDGVIELEANQTIILGYGADYSKEGIIPIQFDLSSKLKRGDRILLNDGKIQGQVSSVRNKLIYLKLLNGGHIIKRKGMNLPDTILGEDVITAKDKKDLIFGSTTDIDYVAQSFVQSSDNIFELRKILKSLNFNADIIAKLETKSAINDLNNIILESDALMVARGDLAYEVKPEAVPVIQNKILNLSRLQSKPVIIATQMLFSMTGSMIPTRAEVSDVANGVMSAADCLMLSDETASGEYPIEAIKLMKKVILYTEKNSPEIENKEHKNQNTPSASICDAVVSLAENIKANAIVAETKSGATAKQIAVRRSSIPLIAVTSDLKTYQKLAIVYGVKSYLRPIDKFAASKLTDWLRQQNILAKGDIVVTASGKYPGVVGTTDTIKVRILDE